MFQFQLSVIQYCALSRSRLLGLQGVKIPIFPIFRRMMYLFYKLYYDYAIIIIFTKLFCNPRTLQELMGRFRNTSDRLCEQTRVPEPKHWILGKGARVTSDHVKP